MHERTRFERSAPLSVVHRPRYTPLNRPSTLGLQGDPISPRKPPQYKIPRPRAEDVADPTFYSRIPTRPASAASYSLGVPSVTHDQTSSQSGLAPRPLSSAHLSRAASATHLTRGTQQQRAAEPEYIDEWKGKLSLFDDKSWLLYPRSRTLKRGPITDVPYQVGTALIHHDRGRGVVDGYEVTHLRLESRPLNLPAPFQAYAGTLSYVRTPSRCVVSSGLNITMQPPVAG